MKQNWIKKVAGLCLGLAMLCGALTYVRQTKTYMAVAENPASPITFDWDSGATQPSGFSSYGSTAAFSTTRFAIKGANAGVKSSSIFDSGTKFASLSVTIYGGENTSSSNSDTLTVSLVDSNGDSISGLSVSKTVKVASMPNASQIDAATINGACHDDYTFSSFALSSATDIRGIKINLDKKTSNYVLRRAVIAYEIGSSKTLSSISVSGAPSKTTYFVGEAFDPKGLVVTGTYSDSTQETITDGINWAFSPNVFSLGNTSCEVTASVAGLSSSPFTVNDLTVKNVSTYKLVSSVDDLEAGANYIISSSFEGSANFMGLYGGGNNIPQTSEFTIVDNAVEFNSEMLVLKLGGNSTNGWTFLTDNFENNGFLNATNTTEKNYLKVIATADNYSTFSISFTNSAAVITCLGKSSRNILRYNSSSSCFSCYSSGQAAVYLYKEYIPDDPNKTLSSLIISGDLDESSKTWIEGQVFVPSSNVKIYAHFTDSIAHPDEDVTSLISWSSLTVGITTVTGSYTYKEITKTCQFSGLTVLEKSVKNISIADKITSYNVEDCFTKSTLTVTAYYDNGTSTIVDNSLITAELLNNDTFERDISNGYTFTLEDVSKTLKINIKFGGKSSSYSIIVVDGPRISRVRIEDLITKTADDLKVVKVIGRVQNIVNTDYGNFDLYSLENPESSIYVYGATKDSSKLVKTDSGSGFYTGTYTSGKNFKNACSANNVIEMEVIFKYYNGTAEIQGIITNVLSDADVASYFASTFMHMSDYTEELGYCKDSTHNYYGIAKKVFNGLSSNEKNEFYKMSEAVARLQAWAKANGEEFNSSNGTFSSLNNKVSLLLGDRKSSNTLIIVVVSLVGLTAIGGYFFYMKRKEN